MLDILLNENGPVDRLDLLLYAEIENGENRESGEPVRSFHGFYMTDNLDDMRRLSDPEKEDEFERLREAAYANSFSLFYSEVAFEAAPDGLSPEMFADSLKCYLGRWPTKLSCLQALKVVSDYTMECFLDLAKLKSGSGRTRDNLDVSNHTIDLLESFGTFPLVIYSEVDRERADGEKVYIGYYGTDSLDDLAGRFSQHEKEIRGKYPEPDDVYYVNFEIISEELFHAFVPPYISKHYAGRWKYEESCYEALRILHLFNKQCLIEISRIKDALAKNRKGYADINDRLKQLVDVILTGVANADLPLYAEDVEHFLVERKMFAPYVKGLFDALGRCEGNERSREVDDHVELINRLHMADSSGDYSGVKAQIIHIRENYGRQQIVL